jgi:hypothetical protein
MATKTTQNPKGAGAKQKYGEPTEVLRFRVPQSKKNIFRAKAKEILKVWETDLTIK